jgi:hypothetical protein
MREAFVQFEWDTVPVMMSVQRLFGIVIPRMSNTTVVKEICLLM